MSRARKALCFLPSLGGTPGEGNVDKAVGPLRVEPDHPVPQSLTVHPTDLGGFFSRGAVKHRRDRQKSACLRPIPRPLGKPANLAPVKSVRTAIAWPMANDPPFATLNHFAVDL